MLGVCAAIVMAAAFATGAEAKTLLRFATDISEADTQGRGAEYFIKLVSDRSNGEIEIRFFPDNTLGNPQAIVSGARTDTIEAQDLPVPALFSGKFYEVQKYLSMTRHAYTAVTVVMNKRKFDKLTPEEQEIILTSAREAAAYQRGLNASSESEMIAGMEKTGLQVNYDVDSDAFMQAAMSVRDIYVKDNGDEFVKLIDAERNKE